jgi:hypothetical protein
MGRKSVREDELLQAGGLLSFPRTGCALLRSIDLSMTKRHQRFGCTINKIAIKWRARRHDFRTFLGNLVSSLHQFDSSSALEL